VLSAAAAAASTVSRAEQGRTGQDRVGEDMNKYADNTQDRTGRERRERIENTALYDVCIYMI